ncbi:MAG: pyruvate dehydrogenase E2 component (dihydrolipoamide acetyltransferase) [Pirellulaceae bacterium]|jgi:pyruvate dehydrogenase E2 component (dihydrolipoamide acetyltransferase)
MPIEIIVPRLGWSMDEGTFLEWLKKDGEFVKQGDMLFTLEGDKASQEVESFDEGILHVPTDAPQPGDAVAVGQRLAYLLAEGESPPASAPVADAIRQREPSNVGESNAGESNAGESNAGESSLAGREIAADATNVKVASPRVASGGVASGGVASPRARRRARELGVDWVNVPGSGRNGRVRERDVIATAAMSSSAQKTLVDLRGVQQPASKIRRAIAQRMLAGAQQTAPVTLTTKVDAAALFAARQQYKLNKPEIAPSYNDILVKLVASVLPECPELNACWSNGAVYTYDDVNIAIAVDTDRGLLAPVLRNVAALSLEEIAAQSRRMAEQALAGKLRHDDLSGGTFTITNLGAFGIDYFTPIINFPQTAILGIGRIADEPVVCGDKVVAGKTLSLSLTFDHRVIDGAPAARWLQRLATAIRQLDVS